MRLQGDFGMLSFPVSFDLGLPFSEYRKDQQFLTSVPWCPGELQEFLKHAIPDYLARGADPFSLRLSNKKRQQPTQQ